MNTPVTQAQAREAIQRARPFGGYGLTEPFEVLLAFIAQHPDAQAGEVTSGGPFGWVKEEPDGDFSFTREPAWPRTYPKLWHPVYRAAPARSEAADTAGAHPPRVTALHTSMLDTAQKRLATVDETLAEVDTLLDEPAAPAVSDRSVNWHQNACQRGVDIYKQWAGSGHSIDHMVQQIVSATLDEAQHEALTARIAELEGENAKLKAQRLQVLEDGEHFWRSRDEWKAKAKTAEREAERLREDAERYRWLRIARSKPVTVPCPYRHDSEKGFDIINGEALDAAIDAARKGETNG